MGKIISNMSMSVDGIIHADTDGVDRLFQWYSAGPQEVASESSAVGYSMEPDNARYLAESKDQIKVIIGGRNVFDEAGGWGGKHPTGAKVIILSHSTPDGWQDTDDIRFMDAHITEAVDAARGLADGADIAIATPTIVKQCLEQGLLDEITIDIVPVLLGKGLRYFDQLDDLDIKLSEPTIVQGTGVTHLRYTVQKD